MSDPTGGNHEIMKCTKIFTNEITVVEIHRKSCILLNIVFTEGCDQNGQNLHLLNANFKFQICSNANSNAAILA